MDMKQAQEEYSRLCMEAGDILMRTHYLDVQLSERKKRMLEINTEMNELKKQPDKPEEKPE